MGRIVVEVWNYISEADIGLLSDYGNIIYISELTNQITMEVEDYWVPEIGALERVKHVWEMPERTLRNPLITQTELSNILTIEEVRSYVRSDMVPYTGDGVRVGIVDTGIDRSKTVCDKIVAEKSFAGSSTHDNIGHGTSIANLICGLAPDVEIVVAKIFDQFGDRAPYSTEMEALEWVAGQNVDLINASFGSDEYFPPERRLIQTIIDVYKTRVIASSGNDGPDKYTIDYPSGYPEVTSVGAVAMSNDQVTSYSSRGPAEGGIVKPELMAPGGWDNECFTDLCLIGSSFSTAVVTGVLSQLYEARKKYDLGCPLGAAYLGAWKPNGNEKKDVNYGWGIIDAEMALAIMERHDLPSLSELEVLVGGKSPPLLPTILAAPLLGFITIKTFQKV